ncbi:MAG: tryptophan-rich sensory protein [Candidatus Levybacteria bacterium]|nr:tryptophan-rich sensory protein [Candidatus Levybacteria bacterium]
MPKKVLQLILAIGVCLGAGVIGSLFTFSAIPTWYSTLNKPFFSPPNWIFGPVWTTLYILMGISLYLVQSSKLKVQSKKKQAVKLFFIQLGFNVLWSILFFGFKNPALAFVDIIALWVAIFLTMKSFYPISRSAFYLLLPYFIWVSFASILNLMIIFLN